MSDTLAAARYRERMRPGLGLYLILLLIVPAVGLVLTPLSLGDYVPAIGAVAVYAVVAVALTLMSPVVTVENGTLSAGRASIPVSMLGEIALLDDEALRAAIGPSLDARSYLVIRGWIHSGLRIRNIDPADPAPEWILTSRAPETLAAAIRAAQAENPV